MGPDGLAGIYPLSALPLDILTVIPLEALCAECSIKTILQNHDLLNILMIPILTEA